MERNDLDIPEGTVWPATETREQPGEPREPAEGEVIELGPGEEAPVSLDPDRDQAERNAAAGGWDGANEQIENDFEAEQLRRAKGSPGQGPDPDPTQLT